MSSLYDKEEQEQSWTSWAA